MATEVTLVLYDPYERGADWWWNLFVNLVEEHEAEIIETDEQEA